MPAPKSRTPTSSAFSPASTATSSLRSRAASWIAEPAWPSPRANLQCLFLLDREGPTSPGAIARRVGLTSGPAARTIDRLIAARRLHALYDPLDARLRELLDIMVTRSLDQLRDFVKTAVTANAELVAGIRPTRGGAG